MKRYAKWIGWAALIGTIGGIAAWGDFHRMITVIYVVFISTLVVMFVSPGVAAIPRTRAAGVPMFRLAVIGFLSLPMLLVGGQLANEALRLAAQRSVERRVSEIEAVRAKLGAYPRAFDFGHEQLYYMSDGKVFDVTWQDHMNCGRSFVYRSVSRDWVSFDSNCFF